MENKIVFDAVLSPDLSALVLIIVIDIVMSGDNAIIIGMAAAGLPPDLRKKAIIYGIVGATALRIVFAAVVVLLLKMPGLMFVGGLLLLWVCWRMWRDIRADHSVEDIAAQSEAKSAKGSEKTLRTAMVNIIVADVSMSLDNVLAVAGVARDHMSMLVFGLLLSIALMGVTANYIARLLERYYWISYLGLFVIACVAIDMIWDGGCEILSVFWGLML